MANDIQDQHSSQIDVDAIRSDLKLLHNMAARALAAAGQPPEQWYHVVCAFRTKAATRSVPMSKAFAVGDFERAATFAIECAKLPGTNVYTCLYVVRSGGQKKPKKHDVGAWFGFVADLDGDKTDGRVSLAALSLQPSCVLQTSSHPKPSHQARYFLDTAIMESGLDLANQIATGLCHAVKDTDGGTKDVSHVWRIAGTLNWPSDAKIRRGRPTAPQSVVAIAAEGDREPRSYPSDLLQAAFVPPADRSATEEATVAYQSHPHSRRYADMRAHRREALGPLVRSTDQWDGKDMAAFHRVINALAAIPSNCTRAEWRQVLGALRNFFHCDVERGRRIALAWSTGGAIELPYGNGEIQCVRLSDHYSDFHVGDFERTFDGVTSVGLGSIYRLAGRHGWSGKTEGVAISEPAPLTPDAEDVKVAAEAFLSAGPRKICIAAWHLEIARNYKTTGKVVGLSADALAIAPVIAELIHSSKGYGEMDFDPLGKALGWEKHIRKGHVRIQRALDSLRKRGFIEKTDARSVTPDGKRIGSFTIIPGKGNTWANIIARYEVFLIDNYGKENAKRYNLGSAPEYVGYGEAQKGASPRVYGEQQIQFEEEERREAEEGAAEVADSAGDLSLGRYHNLLDPEVFENLKRAKATAPASLRRALQELAVAEAWVQAHPDPVVGWAMDFQQMVNECVSTMRWRKFESDRKEFEAARTEHQLNAALAARDEVILPEYTRTPLTGDESLQVLWPSASRFAEDFSRSLNRNVHKRRTAAKDAEIRNAQWQRRGVAEPRHARDGRGYQAAKDGEWVPPTSGARKPSFR